MSRRLLVAVCALATVLAAAVHVAAQTPTPRRSVGIGGFCSHSENCSAPHSVCQNRACTCESGYEVNGTTCTIKLNSNCNTTHICNRTGAHCINNVCICRFDYVLSANYQNCVPVAMSINQPCEVQAQCREFINTSCTAGICQCIPGHKYNISRRSCELSAPSHFPSRGVQQSHAPVIPQYNAEHERRPGLDSVKTAGVMQQPTHLPERIKATANRHGLGMNCTVNANCTITTAYSVCTNGKCACSTGYEMNGTLCIAKVNSSCTTTATCNRNGTICNVTTGQCQCDLLNNVHSWDGKDCLKLATRPYELCIENQQCKNVAHTTCAWGACVCDRASFLNNAGSRCETFPCYQGTCEYLGFANCIQGICDCKPGGVAFGSYCYKQIDKVDKKCDTRTDRCYLTEDGLYQNVECKKGTCKCIKPSKPNKAKTRCLSGASLAAITPIFTLIAVVVALRA